MTKYLFLVLEIVWAKKIVKAKQWDYLPLERISLFYRLHLICGITTANHEL